MKVLHFVKIQFLLFYVSTNFPPKGNDKETRFFSAVFVTSSGIFLDTYFLGPLFCATDITLSETLQQKLELHFDGKTCRNNLSL